MMDDVNEEVGKGHVIQIITDNAANYKAVGDLSMHKRKKVILDTLCSPMH